MNKKYAERVWFKKFQVKWNRWYLPLGIKYIDSSDALGYSAELTVGFLFMKFKLITAMKSNCCFRCFESMGDKCPYGMGL